MSITNFVLDQIKKNSLNTSKTTKTTSKEINEKYYRTIKNRKLLKNKQREQFLSTFPFHYTNNSSINLLDVKQNNKDLFVEDEFKQNLNLLTYYNENDDDDDEEFDEEYWTKYLAEEISSSDDSDESSSSEGSSGDSSNSGKTHSVLINIR